MRAASRAAASIICAHFLFLAVELRLLQEIGSLQDRLQRIAEIVGQSAEVGRRHQTGLVEFSMAVWSLTVCSPPVEYYS